MATGAVLIGRMIRKKIRKCPAPSSRGRLLDLRADAEEELPEEEDRERRHEEERQDDAGEVLSSPSCLIEMKFGSMVKIGGIISAARNSRRPCPGPASASGRTRRPPSR